MNYFGHAVLALLRGSSPAFIFGAMLPDLAPMAGAPVLKPDARVGGDDELWRGARFHLHTDAVFHQTDVFVSQNRRVLSLLRAHQVSRGPARACAHIGVEMLIDATLAQDPRFEVGYLDALLVGVSHSEFLASYTKEQAQRISLLCERLRDGGLALFEASSTRLSFRLRRALQDRPRLRPSPRELIDIVSLLMSLDGVSAQTPTLLDEMKLLYA